MFSLKKAITQQADKLVLQILSRGMRDPSGVFHDGRTLEEVLHLTRVERRKTNLYDLTAPGQHAVWLETPQGEIRCHVKVRLAALPDAPLLLYHHGIAEIPYTSTWQQLLPKSFRFPAHSVAVQAPYHNRISEPISTGFSSVQHVYQMFAGSLRIYELMQEQFEESGAAFTVASGLSWGGITSLLYEALFQSAWATIPLFSSPNLALVMSDGSDLTGRPLPVPRETLTDYFDFTPICDEGDQDRIFPVLGEDDLFFRLDRHAVLYSGKKLLTVPSAHVGAVRRVRKQLRQHILAALEWAARHPR